MGLNLSKESLEERLADINQDVLTDLVVTLKHRGNAKKKDPPYRSPYHKHDLIYRIVHYFEKKGMPFGDSYSDAKTYLAGINKEPLKAVEKGMRRKGISDQGVPDDFIGRLDDFEKIYFFAGIRALEGKLGPHPDISTMDQYELASTYIRAGINHMAYLHNSIRETNRRKRPVTRGPRRETYKNRWGPPHAVKIKERLLRPIDVKTRVDQRYATLTAQFEKLFREEDKYGNMQTTLLTISADEKEANLHELRERISIMLDSLKPFELALLTQKYGSQRLGNYAVR